MWKPCKLVCIKPNFHILSDDKLEAGDWCWNKETDKILQWTVKDATEQTLKLYDHIQKIIATTDGSISVENKLPLAEGRTWTLLPSIPKTFIDKYVSEYNKGNKIEKVMVEHINNFDDVNRLSDFEEPKLNPDNTINIKSVKGSYTRDEIDEILSRAQKACNLPHDDDVLISRNFIEQFLDE